MSILKSFASSVAAPASGESLRLEQFQGQAGPSRRRLLLIVAVVPVVLYFLLARGAFDFDCYWVAAWSIRDGNPTQMYAALDRPNAQGSYDLVGETPVWRALAARHLKNTHQLWAFLYPPPTAAFVLPLTVLPRPAAILLWRLLNLAAYLSSLFMLLKLLRPRLRTTTEQILLFLAIVSPPFLAALAVGQITALVVWTIAAGLYFIKTRRPGLAGACLAVGTLLKITPIVFVAWLLWRREFRACAAWLGTLIALCVVPIFWTGTAVYRVFLTHCLPLLSRGAVSDTNISAVGLLGRLLGLGNPHSGTILPSDMRITLFKLGFYGLIAGVSAAVIWRGRQLDSPDRDIREYAVLNMAALLLSPITWGHHLMSAVLTLFVVVAWADSPRRPGILAAAGIAYVLMLQNRDLPWTYLPIPIGAGLALIGVVTLWGLACTVKEEG